VVTTAAQPRRRPGRPRGPVTGETRDNALVVASRLFATSGYRGTSLADVAQEAGLSNAGLLHYFPSKKHLLAEVLRKRDEDDARELGVLDPGTAIWTRLQTLVNLARMNSTRYGMVRLYSTLSGEAIDADHPAHPWLHGHLSTIVADIADGFEVGKKLGTVRPEAPSVSIARSLVAVMDGLQIQWLAAHDHPFTAPDAGGSDLITDDDLAMTDMGDDVKVFVDGLRRLWQLPDPGPSPTPPVPTSTT
jgi:AcrR family transcriptional regulator